MSRALMTEQEYHHSDAPTYVEPTDGAHKLNAGMAKVAYTPSHANPNAPQELQGAGTTTGTWVFNEEPGKAEGLLASNINLFMDTQMDPNASIGLHKHSTTEEIYYVLEGSLLVDLFDDQGKREFELNPGDAHLIKPGQSHHVRAGEAGARIIVVGANAQT